jgi:hypothetical protein
MEADARTVRTAQANDALSLTAPQVRALAYVRTVAERDRDAAATERAATVLARAGTNVEVGELCASITALGRVALNFHPDRIAAGGRTVAEALLADGMYRNQFETLISNGGLGAVRDRFEERLFAGAYSQVGVTPSERPRYGGLDLVRHPDGPCPRFGSCHLRLRPEVLRRCTFSFGDSVTEPTALGTIDVFEPVLAALLDAAEAGRHTSVIGPCDTVLGLEAASVTMLESLLVDGPAAKSQPGRALDDYIEAQVHGPVRLGNDVEALVADPSFRGSSVGARLEEMADRFGFGLSWHQGFVLDSKEVPAHFRGPEVRALAGRVAADFGDGSDRIDAELIGRAARRVVTDPERFADHEEPSETLQHLKQLWHVLVAYGHPVG